MIFDTASVESEIHISNFQKSDVSDPNPSYSYPAFSKMKRKVLRKVDGQSFVSVESSFCGGDSIVSVHDRFDTDSLCSFSTIDSDLKERLNKLKVNIRNLSNPKITQKVKCH